MISIPKLINTIVFKEEKNQKLDLDLEIKVQVKLVAINYFLNQISFRFN